MFHCMFSIYPMLSAAGGPPTNTHPGAGADSESGCDAPSRGVVRQGGDPRQAAGRRPRPGGETHLLPATGREEHRVSNYS